jgi:hypothetical protein
LPKPPDIFRLGEAHRYNTVKTTRFLCKIRKPLRSPQPDIQAVRDPT